MYARNLSAVAIAALLAGCAAAIELPPPGPGHPANPDAQAAPTPMRSTALVPDEPVAAPAEPMMGGGHEHHH